MTPFLRLTVLSTAILACPLTFAQTTAPAPKPANATGQCKDGTYSTAATKAGACRGHNGVQQWYTAAATPAVTPAPAAKPATAPAPAAAAAPAPAPMPAAKPSVNTSTTAASKNAKLASMSAAAGGGPGLVWVNNSSNVYHCYGSDYYGKTKSGAYMTEAAATAKGAHGDHGKACSK